MASIQFATALPEDSQTRLRPSRGEGEVASQIELPTRNPNEPFYSGATLFFLRLCVSAENGLGARFTQPLAMLFKKARRLY